MGRVVAIPDSVTLTAYAKRRGVSVMTISRACKKGRLRECVVRDASGKAIGISDPELADREWEKNSDYTDAPQRAPKTSSPAGEEVSMSDAAAREKHWKALLAETKYKREAGELVPAAEVEERVRDDYAQVRTKLLGIPSRARQSLPHLTVGDLAVIESLVRESLEELAGDQE